MRYFLFIFIVLSLSLRVVFSQQSETPAQQSQADSTQIEMPIRGEFSVLTTLGGQLADKDPHTQGTSYIAGAFVWEYYVVDGLSIGPELGIYRDASTFIPIVLNVCCTYWQSRKKLGGFFHLGYGQAFPLEEDTYTNKIETFTTGLGVKLKTSLHGLLRFELQYQRRWWISKHADAVIIIDNTGEGYPFFNDRYSHSEKANNIGILLGFSFTF